MIPHSALRSAPSRETDEVGERRTISGEQPIAHVASATLKATRPSATYRVPAEALPSEPPPEPTPDPTKATTQMVVPKRLRELALPTPAQELPTTPVAPVAPVAPAEERLKATVRIRRAMALEAELRNALGLFAALLATSALASGLVAVVFFD